MKRVTSKKALKFHVKEWRTVFLQEGKKNFFLCTELLMLHSSKLCCSWGADTYSAPVCACLRACVDENAATKDSIASIQQLKY